MVGRGSCLREGIDGDISDGVRVAGFPVVFRPGITAHKIGPCADLLKLTLPLIQPNGDRPNRRSACDDQIVFAVIVDIPRLQSQACYAFANVSRQMELRTTRREVDIDLINETTQANGRGLRDMIPVQVMIKPSVV